MVSKRAYDAAMKTYYRVLLNAWDLQAKKAARAAIKMLSDMPKNRKFSEKDVLLLGLQIDQQLGADFAARVQEASKGYIGRCYDYGLGDAGGRLRIKVGRWNAEDAGLVSQIERHNLFWIGNHYGSDVKSGLEKNLKDFVNKGLTKEQMATALAKEFAGVKDKGKAYWQGLAEHTALKTAEFSRIQQYSRAGVKGYRLLIVLDEKTSPICQALRRQHGKTVFGVQKAREVVDACLDTNFKSLKEARAHLQRLTPFVSEKQVEKDENDKPAGIVGETSLFPPFHWKCRTSTVPVV